MIVPRVFHRIWLGSALPKKYKKYGRTWKKHHPSWEMKLWTERNLPDDLLNMNCLELCNNYSEQSDVLRYSLLYKYGGVYIDTDFENYKNIEPLLSKLDIFASSEDNYHICGGFMGSTPEHPIIKRLINLIPTTLKSTMNQPSDHRIGPKFVTENISWDEITVLPREYFYPYLPNVFRSIQIQDKADSRKTAFAAHHWAKSWG